MTSKIFLPLALLSLLVIGCSPGESADTSPPPTKDAQTAASDATKNVESSNMTPEQKQAAAEYLKQGAANAEQIKKSAQGSSAGSP